MVKHIRFCHLSNGQVAQSMEVNKGPDQILGLNPTVIAVLAY